MDDVCNQALAAMRLADPAIADALELAVARRRAAWKALDYAGRLRETIKFYRGRGILGDTVADHLTNRLRALHVTPRAGRGSGWAAVHRLRVVGELGQWTGGAFCWVSAGEVEASIARLAAAAAAAIRQLGIASSELAGPRDRLERLIVAAVRHAEV